MIPALLIGALAVGGFGAAGHAVAKETNDEAQAISRKAKNKYEENKQKLEVLQADMQKQLEVLGNNKMECLNTSVTEFCELFEQVHSALDKVEYKKYNYGEVQETVVSMRELSECYTAALAGGVAGAATAVAVGLAVSGSLVEAAGCVGLAAGLAAEGMGLGFVVDSLGFAGSALASGAAAGFSATPLAAVVAPALFVSGIAASMKSDENLDKAKTMRAEVDAAVEKMKISMDLCEAIEEKAVIINDLLCQINMYFEDALGEFSALVREKEKKYRTKKIPKGAISRSELKIIFKAYTLFETMKICIETPIVENETISPKIQSNIDEIVKKAKENNCNLLVETPVVNVKKNTKAVIRLLNDQIIDFTSGSDFYEYIDADKWSDAIDIDYAQEDVYNCGYKAEAKLMKQYYEKKYNIEADVEIDFPSIEEQIRSIKNSQGRGTINLTIFQLLNISADLYEMGLRSNSQEDRIKEYCKRKYDVDVQVVIRREGFPSVEEQLKIQGCI